MSNWQKLAARKFGNQLISGDGPFAVARCGDIVLVDLEMRAQQLESECCGAHCNHVGNRAGGWHRIYLLAQKEGQRRRFRRIPMALDDD